MIVANGAPGVGKRSLMTALSDLPWTDQEDQALVFLYLFDHRKESLSCVLIRIQQRIQEIQPDQSVLLIANKSDLRKDQPFLDLSQFCEERGVIFMEISIVTNLNLINLRNLILELIEQRPLPEVPLEEAELVESIRLLDQQIIRKSHSRPILQIQIHIGSRICTLDVSIEDTVSILLDRLQLQLSRKINRHKVSALIHKHIEALTNNISKTILKKPAQMIIFNGAAHKITINNEDAHELAFKIILQTNLKKQLINDLASRIQLLQSGKYRMIIYGLKEDIMVLRSEDPLKKLYYARLDFETYSIIADLL